MILAGEQRSLRMSFHCADRSLVYLRPSNLLYAETHSHHTILHTLERNIEVTDALSDIEKRLPDHFLRCHQSYVVNLSYITRIRRFELELTDGTIFSCAGEEVYNPEISFIQYSGLIIRL